MFGNVDLSSFDEIEIPGNDVMSLGEEAPQDPVEVETKDQGEGDPPLIETTEEKEDEEIIVIPDGTEETVQQEDSLDLSPYAAALVDEGILPSLDIEEFGKLDKEGQSSKLIESIDDKVEQGVASYFDQMPQDLRDIILNYQEGVPLDTLVKNRNQVLTYNNISEDELLKSEELMDKLLIEDRMNKGYSKEEALEELELISNKGKAAKISRRNLVKHQATEIEQATAKAKEATAAKKQQDDEMIAGYKNLVFSTEEIIPGIKLSKKEQETVFNAGTGVGQNKTLKDVYAKDPLKAEAIINYLVNVTNGFEDWSKITNTAKTAVTKNLAKQLEADTSKRSRNGVHDTAKNGNVVDALRSYFK